MASSRMMMDLTGGLLAFTIPFDGGSDESPSARLLRFLHKPVAFIILPLFALANTGIVLTGSWQDIFLKAGSLSIMAVPAGSLVAGVAGFFWRRGSLRKTG